MSPAQWLHLILLLSCVASFAWAIQRFFLQPSGNTGGMRVIKASSSIFTVVHCAAIFLHGPPRGWMSVSVALYLMALGLFWWAIATNRARQLSAVFSADLPAHLTQDGPYRFIRHPFYTSYVLTWLAGVPATGQLWLLITVAFMFGLYLKAARMEEEKFRRSKLSEAYENYKLRTGRFLPRLAVRTRVDLDRTSDRR